MSTEELKMIINMISSLGENGKEAFFWWLFMDYGLSAMKLAFVVFALALTIRYVAKLIYDYNVRGLKDVSTMEESAADAVHRMWLYGKRDVADSKTIFDMYNKLKEFSKK